MAQKRSRAAFEADLQAQQSPYVFYGTPLAPLDPHTRDDGSYVPVWKQEVTDERGRKRLHGAFTGGFSAGYFNSVGSKEGWTPQTFVSSRTNRAKAVQKPEDYMDEEDLADAEEAKVLETKGGFSGLGSTADEVGRQGQLMDLFRPQTETMGVILLKKMGWVEGQGIGPLRRRTGPSHDPAGETRNQQNADTSSRLVSFIRKLDTKGLGFGDDGLAGGRLADPQVAKQRSAVAKPMKTKPKRGGFGVGILNDTGSDEEDPYDHGPKLSYNRVAAKKKTKKTENGIMASNPNPLLASKPVFVKKPASNSSSSGFRLCHDGKLPLDGFVLSTQGPVLQDKKFPAPKIPEDWSSSKQRPGNQGPTATTQSTADLAKASTLDPSSRAQLLGETLLPGQSVFDFISPAARDRLAAAAKNPNLPAGTFEGPPKPTTPVQQDSSLPSISQEVAVNALKRTTSGFVPYSDNPEKLSRYRAYLTYHSLSNPDTAEAPKCRPGTRHEDFVAELQEFANAASIFKPMMGAMATRFTSSSSTSGPEASSPSNDADPGTYLLLRPGGKRLTPQEEAAKMGMYGPLTRETTTFFPTRLLCKRFGVSAPRHVQPEPTHGIVATSSGSTGAVASKSESASLAGFANRFTSGGVQSSESEPPERKNRLEILGKKDMDEMRRAAGLPALGEVVRRKEREVVIDPSRNEALEGKRASDETFKDIFGSE